MHRHFNAFAFHRTYTIDVKTHARTLIAIQQCKFISIHLGYSQSAFQSIPHSCIGENEQFFPFVSHIYLLVCFHLCLPFIRALTSSFGCLFSVIWETFFPLVILMLYVFGASIYHLLLIKVSVYTFVAYGIWSICSTFV